MRHSIFSNFNKTEIFTNTQTKFSLLLYARTDYRDYQQKSKRNSENLLRGGIGVSF